MGHVSICNSIPTMLHRSHCGMVTGLEANRGKGLKPAFRLTVVVAHYLSGPASAAGDDNPVPQELETDVS